MKIQIATGPLTAPEIAVSSKLMKLFTDQLQKMYWAEHKLARMLPKLERSATLGLLKKVFNDHSVQTKTHVARLENVFEIIEEKVHGKKCFAINGIVDEGQEIIYETEPGTSQRDAGLIFSMQKAAHYEIGTYGGLVSVANTLGFYDAADLLKQTLNEEKEMDASLTHLAEEYVNFLASREMIND